MGGLAERSRLCRPTAARVLAVWAGILLAVTSCGGSDQSSELKGVAWQWSGLRSGEGLAGLSPIPDSARYLLRLDDDGTFVGRADCKSVAGAYRLSGSELALAVKPTAKGTCAEGSRAAEYIRLLRRVVRYDVYDEGALALGLADEAGQMYFYAASE